MGIESLQGISYEEKMKNTHIEIFLFSLGPLLWEEFSQTLGVHNKQFKSIEEVRWDLTSLSHPHHYFFYLNTRLLS